MGKITCKKIRNYEAWRVKSDLFVVSGAFISLNYHTRLYEVQFVLPMNTLATTIAISSRLVISSADNISQAKKLAKEIFKNKTSLRDRAFESALDFFSNREGEGFLTPEKCSEIFEVISSHIKRHNLPLSD